MNRSQLAQVLHAASRIVTDGDILVIGSQSILGTFSEDQLPDAAVASIEVDIAFFDDPSYEKADLVDAVLGEMSPFHEDHGFYGQGVEITTATLPPGWEGRVVQRQIGGVPRPVSFLERHDLVISKLIAGREKDLAFASALLRANLVDAETLAARMLSMVETIAPAAHHGLAHTVRSLNRPSPSKKDRIGPDPLVTRRRLSCECSGRQPMAGKRYWLDAENLAGHPAPPSGNRGNRGNRGLCCASDGGQAGLTQCVPRHIA